MRAWLHSLGVTFSSLTHVAVSVLHCFCGWIISHCMGRPRFVYLLSVWWAFGLSFFTFTFLFLAMAYMSIDYQVRWCWSHNNKGPSSALPQAAIFSPFVSSDYFPPFKMLVLLLPHFCFIYLTFPTMGNEDLVLTSHLKYILLHLPSQFSYSTIFGQTKN